MFNALSVKRRTFNPELPTSNEVGGLIAMRRTLSDTVCLRPAITGAPFFHN